MIARIRSELKRRATPQKKITSRRFFKTGPGEYAEGDVFIGVTVPECRQIALNFKALSLRENQVLLKSKVHEERLVSLLILVEQFKNADDPAQKKIFDFYLKQKSRVNNWDLVDLSADKIVGRYLLQRNKAPLYALAQSKHLWSRRIAIVSTLHFIRAGQFEDTLALSKFLLTDSHDLMHKACGWMLREVGKKDSKTLERFLDAHCHRMPRTMLRYAVERLPAVKKNKCMKRKVSF